MNNSYFEFLLLSMSLMGWGMLSHHKLKINPAFLPIFIFSSITCAVFGAGLLNFMPHMVNLILYSGLVLFCIYIYFIFRKQYSVKSLFVPATVFFIVFSLYMTLLLKGVILIHYDNFSHWGLIVKEMFKINGLPDGTTMVSFRNYLPGGAVFIYFIGKIIGPDESHALMAQSYLIAANLAVLFFVCRWKKIGVILLSTIASLSLLMIIPNNLFDLLVDTLLGLTALSITVIAYYYRDNWLKSIIVNMPLFVLLLLVKDSGKIFLIINFALILWFIYVYNIKGKKQLFNQGKKLLFATVFLLVIPLFINFLWVQYVEKAYPSFNYADNKFALTEGTIKSINKSEEFISNFTPKFIEASADPKTNFISILILDVLAIFIMLVQYLIRRKISRTLLFSTLFSNFVYVFYVFFCYLMYLYMMPEPEAIVLAGYYRYQSTMIIYFVGLMMLSIIYEWSKFSIDNNKFRFIKFVSLLGIIVLFVYPFKIYINTLTTKPVVDTSLRMHIKSEYEKVAGSASVSGVVHPKVLYYSPISEKDYGYLHYVLTYEHLSKNFTIVTKFSTEQEKENVFALMDQNDYLVVLDSDNDFNRYLSTEFGQENPLGAYKINHEESDLEIIPLQ